MNKNIKIRNDDNNIYNVLKFKLIKRDLANMKID
jgi:hypothetical protein